MFYHRDLLPFLSKTSWWSLNNFRAKTEADCFHSRWKVPGPCSAIVQNGVRGEGKNHGAATSSSSTSFICRLQLFLRRWKRAREGSPSASSSSSFFSLRIRTTKVVAGVKTSFETVYRVTDFDVFLLGQNNRRR